MYAAAKIRLSEQKTKFYLSFREYLRGETSEIRFLFKLDVESSLKNSLSHRKGDKKRGSLKTTPSRLCVFHGIRWQGCTPCMKLCRVPSEWH